MEAPNAAIFKYLWGRFSVLPAEWNSSSWWVREGEGGVERLTKEWAGGTMYLYFYFHFQYIYIYTTFTVDTKVQTPYWTLTVIWWVTVAVSHCISPPRYEWFYSHMSLGTFYTTLKRSLPPWWRFDQLFRSVSSLVTRIIVGGCSFSYNDANMEYDRFLLDDERLIYPGCRWGCSSVKLHFCSARNMHLHARCWHPGSDLSMSSLHTHSDCDHRITEMKTWGIWVTCGEEDMIERWCEMFPKVINFLPQLCHCMAPAEVLRSFPYLSEVELRAVMTDYQIQLTAEPSR